MGARLAARLCATTASCAAVLAYLAGLWEVGVAALLLVIVASLAHADRRRLIGLAGLGVACALASMAVDQTFAAACGTSYQPITCSASSGPGAAAYGIAACALALLGAALLALVPCSREPRESG